MDDPIWSPTTFSKNRDRLLESDIAGAFFDAVVAQARDGRPALGRALHGRRDVARGVGESQELPARRMRGRRRRRTIRAIRRSISTGRSRRNDTHQSTTDPDAQLARKGQGKEAKLSYAGHVLLDNRHGLVANVCVTRGDRHGRTRGGAAAARASAPPRRRPSAATRALTSPSFVAGVRALGDHAARRAEGQRQRD